MNVDVVPLVGGVVCFAIGSCGHLSVTNIVIIVKGSSSRAKKVQKFQIKYQCSE